MAKVCGLAVPFPGAKRPLEEGAKLGMWEFVLLDENQISIPIVDTYILAAWHPIYERLLGLGGRVGVVWTSSVGEMDFEPVEQRYLKALNEDPRVSFIWFGDPGLAKVFPEKGFYSPYPISLEGISPPDVEKEDIATLFCPAGPKKNILNQLLAMKLAQQEMKLTLHTNIQGYDHHLGDLDCVRHGWLPKEEYNRLIASAKVNLACSWCETFNYNVAEAALLGTISVVSSTIPIPGVLVSHPNSPVSIAEKILMCANEHEDLMGTFTPTVKAQLEIRNQEAKRILSERLSL